MKLSNTSMVLILLVCLSLGFNLIIPFFDKRSSASGAVFGYNGTGTSYANIENIAVAGLYQMGSPGGFADSISAYLNVALGYNSPVKCKLYNSDGSAVINGLTGATTVSSSGWATFTFSEPKPQLIDSAFYYLVVYGTSGAGTCTFSYKNTGTTTTTSKAGTYPTFPDTWTGLTSVDTTSTPRIYCTYTENTAPLLNAFSVDYITYSDWDNDNDDVQVDWELTDDDFNTITLYFTYNKGSSARTPTISDYDGKITGITDGESPGYTQSNYDLDWTTTAGWVDYSGTVYIKAVAYDGREYSDIYQDSLTNGIDGTAPTTSTDAISPYIQTISPLSITATASDSLTGMKNIHLWYRYAVDNSSWGSWTDFGTDTGSPWSWSFTFPDSYGYYEFYTRGTDNMLNYENAPGSADTKCRPYSREWRTKQSGWNNFSNTASWQTEQSGWNNFSNTASWQTEQSGWNNFENSLSWSDLEQGWNTFGNESLWTDIEQGWNTFGNNSYMIIDYIFPDDGDLICPTCYLNDTFFYFGVGVNHHNGTLMNITWTTWNGTLLGQLTNVGNGTWHIIPFETVMSIEYDHLYNYTINVTDGVDNIEKIISFSTDTYANCDTMNFIFDTAQMGAFVTIFLFAFFMWMGFRFEEKRSSGAFVLVAGLILLASVSLIYTYLLSIAILMVPVGVFISLLGLNKWLIKPNMAENQQEAKAKTAK